MFDDKKLWFVTGKGGVGKSTVSAALGRHLAASGRTLIVETDSFSVMPDYLGSPEGSGVFEVEENLFTTNLDPGECIVDTFTRFLPSKRLVGAIMNNKIARRFFDAAPSVNEFVILDRVKDYVDGKKGQYDHIIVDLPASGHAVTFLSVPEKLTDMIQVGKVADRTDVVADMIRDRQETGIIAVCMPEQMPVNETIELAGRLNRVIGRGLDGVFLNMFHQEPFASRDREAFQSIYQQATANRSSQTAVIDQQDSSVQKLLEGNALALEWHERDKKYEKLLEDGIGDVPVFKIPVVYDTEGKEVVDDVAGFISGLDSTVN